MSVFWINIDGGVPGRVIALSRVSYGGVMDDNKNWKKKESIDDILSDLNGLLNKMPSILDGIKMPEMKPVDFGKVGQAPGQLFQDNKDLPGPDKGPVPVDGDKTVVLPAFSGLAEGAVLNNKAAPFDGDETVVVNSLSSLPEGAAVPEQESGQFVPQAIGDFLSGADAELSDAGTGPQAGAAKLEGSPLEPPAARDKTDNSGVPSLLISELTAPTKASGSQDAVSEEAGLEAPAQDVGFSFERPGQLPDVKPDKPESFSGLPVAEMARASDSFSDFSIPDIDALMQMSEGEVSGGQDAAVPAPAAAPALSGAAPEPAPSSDDLAEFEKQLAASAPQEMNMDSNKTGDGDQELSPLEQTSEPVQPEVSGATQQSFGVFDPESPVAGNAADAPVPEAASELALSPETVATGLELPVDPAVALEQTATSLAGEVMPPEPVVDAAAGGIELSVSPAPEADAGQTLTVGGNPGEAPAPFGGGLPPVAGEEVPPDGDKTMVLSAPASGGGDEDKTMVFQASVSPGITSRAKISDLAGLSAKSAPETVPPERVRPMFFLYSSGDGALCANLLAELDAVCLRSQASPMYIKRAGVNIFDPEMNVNFILQTVTDSGAAGLVCVGGIPQEKVYEIENVFSSAGIYFRHFDSDSFSHGAVLDLVLEMIIR